MKDINYLIKKSYLIFSIWIFIIYVFYILGLKLFNPLFLVIYANLIGLVLFINIILKSSSINGIILYIIITIIIKIIPLYTLLNNKIYIYDIIISFIIIFIYILYMEYINVNIALVYNNIINVFSSL